MSVHPLALWLHALPNAIATSGQLCHDFYLRGSFSSWYQFLFSKAPRFSTEAAAMVSYADLRRALKNYNGRTTMLKKLAFALAGSNSAMTVRQHRMERKTLVTSRNSRASRPRAHR